MAIFDSQPTNNVLLDDTESLTCVIENSINVNKHTEYSIKVQRGFSKTKCWNVLHRYNDFVALHSSLHHLDSSIKLPSKKLIGNMEPGFILTRQVALQAYLDEILKNNMLACSMPVKKFLDPYNYSSHINEQSLQNVSMALQGNGDYELKGSLPNIGWRLRKNYYLVKQTSNKEQLVMKWCFYGPDKILTEREIQAIALSLMNAEVLYIDRIIGMRSMEMGAYIITNLHSCGTVRDFLYGTCYADSFLSKYATPKQKCPFSLNQLANYGFEILLTLKLLHQLKFPCGHLHPGNVVIGKQTICLLDVENSILGVPCYYRHFIVNHRKINSMEAIDVYSFGHTLYEMAFAEPLTTSTCETYPDGTPPILVSFLELMLSPESCKRGMPTVDTLLTQPLFADVSPNSTGRTSGITFSSNIKQHFEKVATSVETRLQSDQKMVHNDKRQRKIQELLSSDDELRKRKKKMKASSLSSTCAKSSLANPSNVEISPSGSSSTTPTPIQIMDPIAALSITPVEDSRSALLTSICSFNKNKLKRNQLRGE